MTILQKPHDIRSIADALKMSVKKTAQLIEWAMATQKIKISEEGKYTHA
jgi:hypothetical protein